MGVGATAERGAGGGAAGAPDGAAGVGEALLHASAEMATSDPKMGTTYRIFLILISPPPGLNLSSDKYWRQGTSLSRAQTYSVSVKLDAADATRFFWRGPLATTLKVKHLASTRIS